MESFCGDGGIKVAKNSVSPNGQKHIARQTEAVFGRGHGITLHTLRHALATRADQEHPSGYKGAALGDISAMLGHKSTRITHTYLTKTSGRGDALARMLATRYAEKAPGR